MDTLPLEILRAQTTAERAKAFRLRYELYVAQQGLFGANANHQRRWLRDEADEHATIWLATRGPQAIASARMCWGGEQLDAGTRAAFGLDTFAGAVDESAIAIVSRLVVHPEHRDPRLKLRLFVDMLGEALARASEVVLIECEPHLVNRWIKLGFRPYGLTEHPVNGVLVRLALVLGDHAHIAGLGSPLAPFLTQSSGRSACARRVASRLEHSEQVLSQAQDHDEFWAGIEASLSLPALGASLGDLDADELATVLRGAHLLRCSPGSVLIRKRHVSRTLYVLLRGSLIVADEGVEIAEMTRPGEILGEVALFSDGLRTRDVLAGSAGAAVLALSERSVRALIDSRDPAATKFMVALTRSLSGKLSERAGIRATA